MISPNVRRLVLDPAPYLQNAIGLIMWLFVGLIAGLWMTGRGSPNVMMVFSASVVTMNYMIKSPVWRTLPVSRAELGRAQWWILFGRPFMFVAASLVLAWIVVRAGGWLKVSPQDLAAFGFAELCLVTLMGLASVLSTGLMQALGDTGYVAGLAAPLLAAFILGVRWMDKDSFAGHRSEMIVAGACAILMAFFLWLLAPRLPLAMPRVRKNKAGPERSTSASAWPFPARQTLILTGWNRFAAMLGVKLFRALLVLSVLYVCAVLTLRAKVPDTFLDPSWCLALLPMTMTIVAILLTSGLSQRVLAGLPLTALQRAVVMQLIGPLTQAPCFLAACGLMALLTPQGVTLTWLSLYGLMVLASVAMTSVALPLSLRFGRNGQFILIAILCIPWGLAGAMLPALSRGELQVFHLDTHGLMLVLTAFFSVALVAGWLWTWVELSYGRAAYRHNLLTLNGLRWRGN